MLSVLVSAISTVALAQSTGLPDEQETSTEAVVKWHEIEAPPSEVTGIAFSPDGRRFAVTTYKKLSVWSVADRKFVRKFTTEHYTHSPVFGPSGVTVMVADGKGNLEYESKFRVFNIDKGTDQVIGKCIGVVHDVAYSIDRKVMATVSSYGSIGAIISRDKAGFQACGEITLTGTDGPRTIYYPIDKVSSDQDEYYQLASKTIPVHLALTADGSQLAAANKSGVLRIYDTISGKQRHELKGGGSMRYRADGSLECATHIYAANGQLIEERPATAWKTLAGDYTLEQAESGQVTIQNQKTRRRQKLSDEPFEMTSHVAASPDGRYVAVAELKKITIYRIGGSEGGKPSE